MELPFILNNERIRCDVKVHAMGRAPLIKHSYMITEEVVHSSVLRFVSTSHSYFAMVVTPYPRTFFICLRRKPPFVIFGKDLDARYENPSILFSDDGVYWVEKTRNPIFSPPKGASRARGPHNYDPNLIWNPREKRAYLFFNNWGEGIRHVRLMISKDLINWKDMGPTNIEIVNNNKIRVSPTVIYEEEEKKYYMLLVHADLNEEEKPFLELLRSNDGLYWVKTGETNISINVGDLTFYPWHITVRKVGLEYWLLASMNRGNLSRPPMSLFFFKSRDLLTWEGYNKPVLAPSNKGFDDKMVYQGDVIVHNEGVYIWYSAFSKENRCNIGLVRGKLLDEFLRSAQSDNVVQMSSSDEYNELNV
jgi:sucrose-6-phosphate hydrolase SacC (GH32 family)